MPTIGENILTLPDLGKRLQSSGNEQIAAIIEILNQTNPFLDDMPVMECNNGTSHRTTLRSKLPETFWRSFNQGVGVSKSETRQIDEKTGQLGVWSQVDRDLAELNGNKQSFMLSEESAFLEAMNQDMAKNLLYGSIVDNDAAFTGLAPRYSSLNSEFDTAKNVIDAGGTGSANTSVWLVYWGDKTVHGIYPKGLPAGLKRDHYPNSTLKDRDGLEFIGHKTLYTWNLGLAVRDYRSVVRIANIDTSDLDDLIDNGAATAASQKLVRLMLKAHSLIPSSKMGRPVWYMGKTVKLMLDIMAAEKANVNLTVQTFEGDPVTNFYGIPVKQVDAITNDELRVVA